MRSTKERVRISSSSGKSYRRMPKRVTEGLANRSKKANLQCKVCGRYFDSLGNMNIHYSAAGHTREKHPPKSLKWKVNSVDPEKLQKAIAFLEILEDPVKFKEKLKESLQKAKARRVSFDFG